MVTLKEMIKKSKRVKTSHGQAGKSASTSTVSTTSTTSSTAIPISTSSHKANITTNTTTKTNRKSKSPLQLETVVEEDYNCGSGGMKDVECVDSQAFPADEDFGEFAPLRRVQSRDSGYCSIGAVEKGRV